MNGDFVSPLQDWKYIEFRLKVTMFPDSSVLFSFIDANILYA